MFYKFIKRTFDIIISLIGLIITLPIWIITIIGIEISNPGPVFYLAKRVGKDDKIFNMFKFRSMKVDKNANEKNFKADEKRIFFFGKFIRATKIDELPQLLNILFNHMSIVGPRPASIDQVKMVRAKENAIVSKSKPGLTGPSALYDYIYGDSIEEENEYREKVLPTRLALDIWYVNHTSLWTDLKMIWWTFISVLLSIFKKTSKKILKKLTNFIEKDMYIINTKELV